MDHLPSLRKLGLNQNNQEIYLALLQLGKATGNQVALRTKIKRPTTYDILHRLQNEQFIYSTEENGRQYFIAFPPEQLIARLDEQKRELEYDLPILRSLYNFENEKPKISYFTGEDGIKQVFEATLDQVRGSEILAIVSNQTPAKLPGYTKDYVKRRVLAGIQLRGIYQDSATIRQYLKNDAEQLRNSKIFLENEFPIQNEINIFGNKVIIATYEPEPYGILIESRAIAETHRVMFEKLWETAQNNLS